MYLLNPDKTTEKTEGNIFTFHYVSIKSIGARNMSGTESQFTFHYVSIKSKTSKQVMKLREIYIPLCIY